MPEPRTTLATLASGWDDDLGELAAGLAARALPGESVEVYVRRTVETDVRAFDGAVESLTSAATGGVGVRVISDGRQGFAHAGTLLGDALGEVLDEARDNAVFATPDPANGLAEADGVAPCSLELWDDDLVARDLDEKVELALELERTTRRRDPRVRQVSSADYGDAASEWALATSAGIVAGGRRTICSLSVSAIAGTGDDSHTGVGFAVGRGPGVLDLDAVAGDAVERATLLLGAGRPRSRRCTVVLDRRVTSTLLGILAGALSGEAVAKGRSFFAGRVGDAVGAPSLTLVDDPTDPRSLGAARFDAEGLACRATTLIEGGVLRGFVHDSVSARRSGGRSTGSAVRGGYASTPTAGCRAVVLAPGSGDRDAILEQVGDGIYVQSVTGVHSGVNPVSGDFSVGAEGCVIRDGALAEPFREATVASTLQRMLQSLVAVGDDLAWLPGVAAGQTVAIDQMTVSGA